MRESPKPIHDGDPRSSQPSRRRRGFTLIEVMVVIAIITIVSWIGFALVGVMRGGDPLEAAAAAIKGSVMRSRSQALATGSRLNLLVDFEKNSLIPLERRTIGTFSFESEVGSHGRILILGPQVFLTARESADRPANPMWNGGSLSLSGGTARLPMLGDLSKARGADGVAVSLALYPEFTQDFSGPIISGGGGLWSLDAELLSNGACNLVARADGSEAIASVPIPPFQWSTVEIYVTPVLLQIIVNGVPATAKLDDRMLSFPAGLGDDIVFGYENAPNVMIDDLRIDSITRGDSVPLQNARLLPPGVSATLAFDPGAMFANGGDPTMIEGADDFSSAPLPLVAASAWEIGVPPPRMALIGFDSKGALDQSMHQGRVVLDIVARYPDGTIQQMAVDVSTSGMVTSKRVANRVVDAESIPPPLDGQ